MKKALAVFGIGLGIFLIVLLWRAWTLSPIEAAPLTFAAPAVDPQGMAERFAKALTFRSISSRETPKKHAADFAALNAYLRTTFPRVHAELELSTVDDHGLLFKWPGLAPDRPPILLCAHSDVVPVANDSDAEWQHPPFAGVVADGFVWGRGSMDFKHGVVGILEAAETLLRDGVRPKRTFYFAFGHDEEVGGTRGAAQIAARLAKAGVRLEMVLDEGMVVTDGIVPGIDVPVAMIGIAEKGYATLALSADGQGGHSSMPPPQTAVGIVSAAVARLEQNPLPASLAGAPQLLFSQLAPHMGFGERLLFGNLWLFEGLVVSQLAKENSTNALIRTTTAATMFEGSPKENVLPVRAKALVNFRIRPGETPASVLAAAREIIADPRLSVTLAGDTASLPSAVVAHRPGRLVIRNLPSLDRRPGTYVSELSQPSVGLAQTLYNHQGVAGLFEQFLGGFAESRDQLICSCDLFPVHDAKVIALLIDVETVGRLV